MNKAKRAPYKEDAYLDKLISDGKLVKVYLVNGVGLTGKILGNDEFSLMLSKADNSKTQRHSQVVYKHAITSIAEAQEIQDRWYNE